MKFTLATLVLAASSAVAFTITTPEGWTTTGPNTIEFSAVSSDASTFAVTLSPQSNSNNATVIAESHDASETSFTVTAACDDLFPAGDNYVLNFIRNSSSLSTVLAQSQTFNISASTTSCSSSSSSSSAASSAKSSATSAGASAASSGAAAASATASGTSAGFATLALSPASLLGAGALALLSLA